MSNAYLQGNQASPPPPVIATSYITDSGTAIPAGNILKVFGTSTIDNNDNGIHTVANPNLGNVIDVELTNRIVVTAITSDGAGQTQTVNVYTPAFNSSAVFNVLVCGYDLADNAAVGGQQVGLYLIAGGLPVILGTNDTLDEASGPLIAADWNVIANGASLAVQFVGVAGKTITWRARFEYSPSGF